MATCTRISMISNIERTMDFPQYTQDEFLRRYVLWVNGELIQNAFPDLSDEEREFIKTGITPEEWATAFEDPEDS